jgi:hypothetical protein
MTVLIFPAKPLSGPGSESENSVKFAVYLLQSPNTFFPSWNESRRDE